MTAQIIQLHVTIRKRLSRPEPKKKEPQVWTCNACDSQAMVVHVDGRVQCDGCGEMFPELHVTIRERP